jgi:hypothetical protein
MSISGVVSRIVGRAETICNGLFSFSELRMDEASPFTNLRTAGRMKLANPTAPAARREASW